MGNCRERVRNLGCSYADNIPHEVHVHLDPHGVVQARWLMVARELPIEDGLPLQTQIDLQEAPKKKPPYSIADTFRLEMT